MINKAKKYLNKKENRIVLSVFIITIFVACMPLISKYCVNGHDLEYHLLRIESLKEGILIGKPFLKVNTLFFAGAGYASSMFYPDFLLYMPALFRVLGVSINASYHLFVAMVIILSYLSMYYCVKEMTGSFNAGIISAMIVTLCQYHMDDIYVRGAVGEYCAFIFVPITVYAFYNIFYQNMSKKWLFVAGFSGLLLCHTSTFVMCTTFGIIFILINIKKIISNKKIMLFILMATFITLLLTAFYWVPMLEQFLSTSFYVSRPWMQPKDEALNVIRVFGSNFPSLGFLPFIFCILRLFISKNENNKELLSFADIVLTVGFFFTFMTTDIIPWDRIGKYLLFIQFPWRFFIIGSVMLSMAVGVIILCMVNEFINEYGINQIAIEKSLLAVILTASVVSGLIAVEKADITYYDYSNDYYSYEPFTANVIAGEWLPVSVTDKENLVDDSKIMVDSNGKEISFTRIKTSIEAEIMDSATYIDVPFIYYKGYKAVLSDYNSNEEIELTVTKDGNNGMCRVFLKEGSYGRLKVYYAGTNAQLFANIVSLFTVIMITGSLVLSFSKKKKDVFQKENAHV